MDSSTTSVPATCAAFGWCSVSPRTTPRLDSATQPAIPSPTSTAAFWAVTARQHHVRNRLAGRLGLRLDLGRLLLDQLQHDVDHPGIELLAGLLSKFRDDRVERQRLAVGAIGGHGVNDITGVHDSCFDRNRLPFPPLVKRL